MIKLDELNKLITKTEKLIQKQFGDVSYVPDSANFQTKSSEDFEKYVEKFESEGMKLLHKLSHAGRRIYVYELAETIGTIKYIELSEPKPASHLERNEWEYVSYVVEDYDKFLKENRATQPLRKVRVIGKDKFCYLFNGTGCVQFRNNSVSQSVSPEEKNGSQDLKKLYEEEKTKRMSLMADFENFRRINASQAETMKLNSKLDIFRSLVEILDDMDRAMDQGDDGVKAIYDKILTLLGEHGIKAIEIDAGDPFDPTHMEALTTVPAPDANSDNLVQEVIQKGFVHEETDRIIRMPKVVVAKYNG